MACTFLSIGLGIFPPAMDFSEKKESDDRDGQKSHPSGSEEQTIHLNPVFRKDQAELMEMKEIKPFISKIRKDSQSSIIKAQNLHFPHALGFRMGSSYGSNLYNWDLLFNWTFLHSEPSQARKQDEARGNFQNPIVAKESIDIHICDADIGKTFQIANGLPVRLFWGIKLARINRTSQVYSIDFQGDRIDSLVTLANPTQDSILGIGPRIGFNTRWNLGIAGLSLWVKTAGSLLWDPIHPSVGENGAFYLRKENGFGWITEIFTRISYNRRFSNLGLTLSVGYDAQYGLEQISSEEAAIPFDFFDMQGVSASLALSF